MARIRCSTHQSISTTDPSVAETLRLLSHELNSAWGILCGATSILEQDTSASPDRDPFEAIQNRAAQGLQAIVAQVVSLFPQQTLISQLAKSLPRGQEATWSTIRLTQLTPLVHAVNHVLQEGVTFIH